MKIAVVTTLINAGTVVEFFIDYHLSIGFDHIFLFFDDPSDPSAIVASKYRNVTVVLNDLLLKERWENTRLLGLNLNYCQYIDKEVMARQLLNVEVANNMAVESGIDWLLHIDIDELFYCPDQFIRSHFNELSTKGVKHVTYLNHEAVAEQVHIGNYFQEVSLFKKNISLLTGDQIALIVGERYFDFGNRYFLYYNVGKSAAVVDRDLIPFTVHRMVDASSEICSNPSILHYSLCGVDHFMSKYRTLGAFPDKWFDTVDIRSNIPFHLEARNQVLNDDGDSALQFYLSRVMIDGQELTQRLLEAGVFFRVNLTDIKPIIL